MKCQSCGHTVLRRAQFCASCGTPIVPRVNEQRHAAEKSSWPLYAALLAAGVLLGAFVVYFVLNKKEPQVEHTHFDGTLRGAALAQQYPAVYEVAAQFICPCGTCTDGLEVCDCGMPKGSTEVRTLIFELLQQHHVPHVIDLIEKQYGYRKDKPLPTFNPPASDSTHGAWARPR